MFFSWNSPKEWIDHTKNNGDFPNIKFHHSPCTMSTFESKICTYYDTLPNVTPDLIYIDAPDQYNILGEIRGISTRSESRLPMSADILSIEHFLHPGTLIIIDGRTGNARFLKENFQKNWIHYYSTEFDQHFFELKEAVDESNFRYNQIKKLFFYKSGRWDVEMNSGLLIKLPSKGVKESLKLLIIFLDHNKKKNIKEVDLRQNKQIIING